MQKCDVMPTVIASRESATAPHNVKRVLPHTPGHSIYTRTILLLTHTHKRRHTRRRNNNAVYVLSHFKKLSAYCCKMNAVV